MYPVLFHIGKLTFYTHGVIAVLGIIVGAIIIYYLARTKALNTDSFFDNIIFTALFGIIGARLAYFIVYPSQFTSASQLLFLWEGGLISYGGFLIGGIVFALLLKKQAEPIFSWFDLASIGFFAGLFIGRVGDIFAGEYAGVKTTEKWLSIFPQNNLVAIPFFEAILCLLIFIFLIIVFKRFSDKLKSGFLFLLSVFLYSAGRFIIDFGRDEKDIIMSLSLGQLMSLAIFLAVNISLIFLVKRREYETGQ